MESIIGLAGEYGFWAIPIFVIIYILINSKIEVRYPRPKRQNEDT